MNDNMPQMKPIEMPKKNLDLSTTYNMASTVQRQMDEMNRESMRIAQEAYLAIHLSSRKQGDHQNNQ